MTDLESRLVKIEARNAARTPGEWTVSNAGMHYAVADSVGVFAGVAHDVDTDEQDEKDAAFIASASMDIPWLLALVREQAKEIAEHDRLWAAADAEQDALMASNAELRGKVVEQAKEITALRVLLLAVCDAARFFHPANRHTDHSDLYRELERVLGKENCDG